MLIPWFDRLCRLLQALMVLCLAAMVVMVFGNVVLRYGFNDGIAMSEEVSRWLFLWVIFMGATVAVHQKAHMGTDMLVVHLPPAARKSADALAHVLMLAVTALMAQGSLAQTRINWDVQAPVTEWSMAWVYASGLMFSVLTFVMLLGDLWRVVTTPAATLYAAAGQAPTTPGEAA